MSIIHEPPGVDPDHYYADLALAFVRGRRPDLVGPDLTATLSRAAAAGLRLHRFKRTAPLARVARVLGVLRGFAPRRLLDVGAGRGAFLWPLLQALPEVSVAAIDTLPHRVADIGAVRRGGVERLLAARMDVTRLGFAGQSFDVVTILEVLEHLTDPESAAAEVVRAARHAIVATVPSRADDNPGHLRRFDRDSLVGLFLRAGARRVEVTYVLGHIVAVAVK